MHTVWKWDPSIDDFVLLAIRATKKSAIQDAIMRGGVLENRVNTSGFYIHHSIEDLRADAKKRPSTRAKLEEFAAAGMDIAEIILAGI